jgi:hypothetical protein
LMLFYASMLMLFELKGRRMLKTENAKLEPNEKGGEEKWTSESSSPRKT